MSPLSQTPCHPHLVPALPRCPLCHPTPCHPIPSVLTIPTPCCPHPVSMLSPTCHPGPCHPALCHRHLASPPSPSLGHPVTPCSMSPPSGCPPCHPILGVPNSPFVATPGAGAQGQGGHRPGAGTLLSLLPGCPGVQGELGCVAGGRAGFWGAAPAFQTWGDSSDTVPVPPLARTMSTSC